MKRAAILLLLAGLFTGCAVLSGLQAIGDNQKINKAAEEKEGLAKYSQETGADIRVSLRSLDSFGDERAQILFKELIDGKSEIMPVEDKAYQSCIIIRDDGSKLIEINRLNLSPENIEYKLVVALILQDAAYRDGNNIKEESIQAVTAHTKMAIELEKQFGAFSYKNIVEDIKNYKDNKDKFKEYIMNTYDITGNQWKLK